jgi:DNA-binding CsgD family transcriptional regulator
MKPVAYTEASKIWKTIAHEIDEQAFEFDMNVHKKLLNVFQVGEWYYYIFNIKHSCFNFVSQEMSDVLGYKHEDIDVPLLVGAMHPEDQPWFLNFEYKVGEFFATLSYNQIPNYKVSYDYRVRKQNGEYIRILQQSLAISFDANGNLLRSLGIHTNISHLKSSGKPSLSFIGLNNEPSYYNIDVKEVFKTSSLNLTKREREILCLLINGHNSSNISEILSVSKQTVDTHRKNLLRKTECMNTAELIAKSIRNGWV